MAKAKLLRETAEKMKGCPFAAAFMGKNAVSKPPSSNGPMIAKLSEQTDQNMLSAAQNVFSNAQGADDVEKSPLSRQPQS